MRYDIRHRPRPDRSSPPKIQAALVAVSLFALCLWAVVNPTVLVVLLVAVVLVGAFILVPWGVINVIRRLLTTTLGAPDRGRHARGSEIQKHRGEAHDRKHKRPDES